MRRQTVAILAVGALVAACGDMQSTLAPDGQTDLRAGGADRARQATHHQKTGFNPMTGLSTQDLTQGLTPEDLAQALVGEGVSISNVTYTGAGVAAGTFQGGTGIIGFEQGIVLSSGCVSNVVGPNTEPDITCINNTPGDADLTELAGVPTFDAAVLEFDFVPNTDRIFIQYVFASDEYNEYVGSFNDVFGFFVNGVNYATVGSPPVPVAINTINQGQPGTPPVNPELYINNDPFNPNFFGEVVAPGDLLNTEMDGLTVVLTFEAPVTPGETNRMKLAIADAIDNVLDSNVFIQAGTLAVCTPIEAGAVYSDGREPGEVSLEDEYLYVEIYDVEQYLGRTASASDVRLGDGFASGVAAEAFEIADLNEDGRRDIRLRFSVSALIDAGELGPDTEQIRLWGRDSTTGVLYCVTTGIQIVPPPIA
jgi:hypothetical protein